MPYARRWLIVAGSLHPVTRRQTEVAAAAGMSVLTTGETDEGDRPGVAKRLAEEARRVIEREDIDLVAVTGGETAVALLESSGLSSRWTSPARPAPGLALGYVRAPNHPQLPILTKAGGFGPDDLFVALAAEATAGETHA